MSELGWSRTAICLQHSFASCLYWRRSRASRHREQHGTAWTDSLARSRILASFPRMHAPVDFSRSDRAYTDIIMTPSEDRVEGSRFREVGLFGGLSDEVLDHLARTLHIARAAAGEILLARAMSVPERCSSFSRARSRS